jgi:putative ABC transport system permease protein
MFLGLLHEAWISIGASRLRTFLAMLGIVIGVGSVVLMLAIGSGSRRSVQESIDKLGSNLLIVTPGSMESKGLRTSDFTNLTMQDADAIAHIATVVDTAPATRPRDFQLAVGKLNWSSRIIGSTPSYFAIRNWVFAQGDSFTEEDMRLGKNVAVVGATIIDKLFKDESALGSTMRINGQPFKIIGILEAKGQGLDGRDQDDTVIIPITTAKSRLWGSSYVRGITDMIYAQASSRDVIDQTIEDIVELMRKRNKLKETMGDNFTVHNLTSITQVATEATKALSILLGAIASISLVVGGIGIMNIMLVTVTERTREIGIRKAIGASEHSILTQFLMEAVIISGVGSALGLVIGYAIGGAAQKWMATPVEYSLWSVILALGVAVGVGILSGLYPAYKAAKLQPIEALRVAGA